MPYTDALYVMENEVETTTWCVYLEDEVEDTDPDTRSVATSACTERMRGTGHLITVKEHVDEHWERILVPETLAVWLDEDTVCEECARVAAERLGIEDEVSKA